MMKDMASAKGGEMIGRMAMSLKIFLKGIFRYASTYAKMKPMRVAKKLTKSPRKMVFTRTSMFSWWLRASR